MRAGSGRGSRRAHDQAGASIPRRHRRGSGTVRRAHLRLQRERRVRDGQGGGRAGLARRAPSRAREPDRRQAGGRRRHSHLLGEGSRAMVVATSLWRRAQAVIPGGGSSPVRAWRAVRAGEPFFARRGEGAYLEDTEGRRYVDWVMSWGPLVFGHADPEVLEAVQEALADGTTFGAPTEREVELAEELCAAMP